MKLPSFGPRMKSSLIFWTIAPEAAVVPFSTPFRNNRILLPSNVSATCTTVPADTAFAGDDTHLIVPPTFIIAEITFESECWIATAVFESVPVTFPDDDKMLYVPVDTEKFGL